MSAHAELSPFAARLPWSRARATRSWMRALGSLAVLRIGVLAVLPLVFAHVFERDLFDEMAKGFLFPAAFIGVVSYCERRFLRRPPKGMLAAQLGFFCVGAAMQAVAIVSFPNLEGVSTVVLSGSTLLIGSWFVGVLLVPEA